MVFGKKRHLVKSLTQLSTGQHLQRREEVEKEVQAQEHQPASTERD